jgi:hypothetical protein
MIDQFTLGEFEKALDNIIPLGWLPLGMDLNEYCYIIEVNSNARIYIRSSVGANGIADKAGQDSIRLNLEVWQPDFRRNEHYEWIALPKKSVTSQRWVTRVPGWQERLEEKIRLYWDVAKEFRQPVESCSCGKAPFVGISKSEKNKGRPYSSCLQKHGGCGLFMWLDKPQEGQVKFSGDNSIQVSDKEDEVSSLCLSGQRSIVMHESKDKQQHASAIVPDEQSGAKSDLQTLSQSGRETTTIKLEVKDDSLLLQSADETISSGNREEAQAEKFVQVTGTQLKDTLQDDNLERDTTEECLPEVPQSSDASQEKKANPKQLEAIKAPINANIRVLAPPGSGKTFVIERRYKYLVDNGIDPDNILVVTFSKSMADEMASRILDICPQADIDQISTIHAFCYRLLTKWDRNGDYYGWKVAGGKDSPVKSWEIKKWLDDFIIDEWGRYEEKPGYQEVLEWIDTSKYHGLKSNECLNFFIKTRGLLNGKRVYNIRKKFDAMLHQRKCMTFADMLLLTELKLKEDFAFRVWCQDLKLKEDFAFRVWCQDKFSHVIIDEGQDTTYNAMRILMTVAVESGENPIYENL